MDFLILLYNTYCLEIKKVANSNRENTKKQSEKKYNRNEIKNKLKS